MIGDGEALVPMRKALASCQSAPGALQDVAIGLSLLGDPLASSTLSGMLLEASPPETQRSLASALGWGRDPRLLPLLSGAFQRESDDLSRAWLAVAIGRIAGLSAKPWNAALMRCTNYCGATATLTNPRSATGVLDYP
jgi:HEAT repeat protein